LKQRFLEFEADLDRRCLYRAGREVPLRPKAFQVLEVLLTNHDRLVTRKELFEEVWAGTAVTDDVLAGAIAELRKALGDDPKTPSCIRTVPRQGYRFVAPIATIATIPSDLTVPANPVPVPPRWAKRPVLVATSLIILAGAIAFAVWRIRLLHPAPVNLREVAWWTFDEPRGTALRDSSGNSADGTLFGNATRAPGKSGYALDLTTGPAPAGANGLDGKSALPVGDRSRSVTAWFLAKSTSGAMTTIFNYGPADLQWRPAASVNIQMRADGRLLVGLELANLGLDSRDRFDDGRWHHLAVVFRGPPSPGDTRLYVDGREQAAGRIAPRNTAGKLRWFIGGSPAGETPFRGLIDDVRVFNGALKPETVAALYRCALPAADVEIGGAKFFFLPIHDGAEVQPDLSAEHAESVRNAAMDAGGIQFARAENACSVAYLKGADVGQDLRMTADFLTPSDGEGHGTEAGFYFRSKLADPGDGIFGGTSAGYAVFLHSFGMVSVRNLNPISAVAYAKLPEYDPARFHRLEVAARGDRLGVTVDGRAVEFDQAGKATRDVAIPSTWEGSPRHGKDQGAAGVIFFAENNRRRLGGQTAKNILVERMGN